MAFAHRTSTGNYRYAYQGQEKDPETGKEAFELRLWDARIGRWLTTDPAGQYSSPYLGMGNNPMLLIDPDGGFVLGPPIFGEGVGRKQAQKARVSTPVITGALRERLIEGRSAVRQVGKHAGDAQSLLLMTTVISGGTTAEVTVPLMAMIEPLQFGTDITSLVISGVLQDTKGVVQDFSNLLTPAVIDNSISRPLKNSLFSNLIDDPATDAGTKLINEGIKQSFDKELDNQLKHKVKK